MKYPRVGRREVEAGTGFGFGGGTGGWVILAEPRIRFSDEYRVPTSPAGAKSDTSDRTRADPSR